MKTRFNVCDLNAIETRVGAYLASCKSLMDVFVPYTSPDGVFHPNGRDPYLAFASQMYGIPYEKLYADYQGYNGKEAKAAAKRMRQIAKPGVLGAIYRLSGGGWGNSKNGYVDHTQECVDSKQSKKFCGCPKIYDRVKIGLYGYADNMGVEMTQEQAQMVVRMFRSAYWEICDPQKGIWKLLEDAVIDVMRGINTVRYIGPNSCVKIDKINVEDRDPVLRMQLPSGRYLHYLDARLEMVKMPWKNSETGEDVYREALVYAGTNQDTKQWDVWVQTHGGKLFENLVQGIARDILAVKLLAFEDADMPVVGHVHDEGICQVPNDIFSPTVEDMVRIMSEPVDWAPDLLLGADGFEDTFYHK